MDAEKPKKMYHVIAMEAQVFITKLLRDKEAFHLQLIEQHEKNTLDVVHNRTYYRIVSNTGDSKTVDAFSSVMDSKQIKGIIKERGWNQKQIAEYWGVSENWIYLLIKNEGSERSVRDDCAFVGLPKR